MQATQACKRPENYNWKRTNGVEAEVGNPDNCSILGIGGGVFTTFNEDGDICIGLNVTRENIALFNSDAGLKIQIIK